MTDYKSFLAGSITGISQVLVGHPFDTIKVYYQNEVVQNKNRYSIRNLYNGIRYPLFTSTLLVSLQFGIYDNYRKNNYSLTYSSSVAGFVTGLVMTPIDRFKIKRQTFSKNIYHKPFIGLLPTLLREVPANIIYFNSYYYLKENNYSILLSGGIAGVLCWGLTFPIDVIKTRVQSSESVTFVQALKKGGLLKGITPCLIRAILVNSIGFYIYENSLKLLI